MANKANLANAIIGSAVATGDTSITLQAGYGSTMPAVPFYATITPFGQLSTMGNSEIVSVTAVSGDTMTVTRAQKSTTAKAFAAGDVFSNGIYTEDWQDLIDKIYPVGSLYMSINSTNPSTFIGGTWSAYAPGRTIVGVGSNGTTSYSASQATGGADSVTLTVDQMPSHSHPLSTTRGGSNPWVLIDRGAAENDSWGAAQSNPSNVTSGQSFIVNNTGGGGSHENRMPYITTYIWVRTA